MSELTEHDIQCSFIDWVHWTEKIDERLKLMFAVPNGGYRSIKTAIAMKKEGVRSGVPDVMFPLPVESFNGLAIEFKRPKGKLSQAQKEYQDRLMFAGWNVQTHYSVDTAIKAVREYLNIK